MKKTHRITLNCACGNVSFWEVIQDTHKAWIVCAECTARKVIWRSGQ